MKDMEVKNAIAALTNEIRETYRFSLFPTSELYKEPEDIVDMIGGGIQYDSGLSNVYVCRCGNGFLIHAPETEEQTTKLQFFAQGLAVLFLKLKFEISEEDFHEFENMRLHPFDNELYREFADEMLCPMATVQSIIERQTRYGDSISMWEIARKTGLDIEYIKKRIKHHYESMEV